MNEYGKLLLKIKVHPTLWFVIGISVVTAHFMEMIMLLGVIFIHEMGHAVCAQYYKWRIKSIQLLPFGGMLQTDEYGNKSLKEDMWVILSGPLQHIWLVGSAFLFHSLSYISYDVYQSFFYMNVLLLVFNLLPIWPLDGGRLLFIGLAYFYSFLEALTYTLYISIIIALLVFLTWMMADPLNLNVWIMALFIAISLFLEWRQRYYGFIRFLLQRHYGKSTDLSKLRPIKADENEPIYKVLESFQRGCKHPIIVLKNGKENGTLDETELLYAYFSEKRTKDKIGDLLYSY